MAIEGERHQEGLARNDQTEILYNLSRASYEETWGKDYQKPSSIDKFLALLYRVLPKIGPLKILTFRGPTPETEKLFESSFNVTLDRYRVLLTDLGRGKVTLANENFDVGEITARGKYRLNDETYAQLLDKLAEKDFADTSPTFARGAITLLHQPRRTSLDKDKREGPRKIAAGCGEAQERASNSCCC